MDSEWQLAQLNIARLIAPRGDQRVQPFFDALDRINALAEESDGYIWRLEGEDGDATELQPTPDPDLIINMSVWRDADSLFNFVYRSAHTPVMAKRREWFSRFDGVYQVLWWVPAGKMPSIDEGFARLWMLERFGPSAQAFTFKRRYPAPDEIGPMIDHKPDPWCIGHA